MGFASFVIADAKEVGPTAAFALEMPFEEDAIIMESKAFLFENMNMITDVKCMNVASEEAKAVPEGANAIGNAVPGKPVPHFF